MSRKHHPKDSPTVSREPDRRSAETREPRFDNSRLVSEMGEAASVAPELVVQAGFQMVERVAFALVVEPPIAGQLDRMLALVGNSTLSQTRRADLEDRLVSKDVLRGAIEQAFAESFGDSDRETVLGLVNDVWHGLAEGAQPSSDASSLASGAQALVSDLADGLARPGLNTGPVGAGQALVALSQAVAAAALFEEQEEGYGVNPELGGDDDPEEG